jgi:hypothetical protein
LYLLSRDGRFIGANRRLQLLDQCGLLFDRLARDRFFGEQIFIARLIELGRFQLRLVAGLLRFGLAQIGDDGAIVDAAEQLAALDQLALLEQHFSHDAADLRAQHDVVQ